MANEHFRIAFKLGDWEVSKYALLAVAGIILMCFTILVQAKRRGYPIKPLEQFAIIACLLAFVGARSWFLFGHWTKTVHNVWDIFAIWRGGMAIEGAALFVMAGSFVFFWRIKHKYGVSMWKYFDIIGPNVFLMQAIGRWGNFFNQEILGPQISPNQFPLNILPHYIVVHLKLASENMSGSANYRQPFFLYESVINFTFWLFLLFYVESVDKQKAKKMQKKVTRMQKLQLLEKIAAKEGKKINLIQDRLSVIKREIKRENKKNSKLQKKRGKINVQIGNKAVIWFFCYGFIRMIMEPFRDKEDILKIGRLQFSTFTSAVFVVISAIIFCLNEQIIRWKYWKRTVMVK